MKNLKIYGDLSARVSLLSGRLERREYRPYNITKMDQSGWPGDWEGRTILALSKLWEITGREPAYLRANIAAVRAELNERGYLGQIMPDGVFDEQQLSGHSWLVRSLIAYYRITGDAEVYSMIQSIGENLFLPTYNGYRTYPSDIKDRIVGGGEAGNIAAVVGNWHISTDTGCVFIPLDGISELYVTTGDERYRDLFYEAQKYFISLDFIGSKVQTHATLTACRALLRMYSAVGDSSLLDSVKRIFSLYTSYGMTAAYANYNWFTRPEWTEPCAIIDSFIVAMELGKITGESDYFTLASRIYYNAMGFAQRENGGFGCDTCVGAVGVDSNHTLRMTTPEAYWCCTMRGGEGLYSAAQYSFIEAGEKIVLPYLTTASAALSLSGGEITIREKSDYPYTPSAVFNIEENTVGSCTVEIILTQSSQSITVDGAEYSQNGNVLSVYISRETEKFSVSFVLPITHEKSLGSNDKERELIFYGNAILASCGSDDIALTEKDLEEAKFTDGHKFEIGGKLFTPLFAAYDEGHDERVVMVKIL